MSYTFQFGPLMETLAEAASNFYGTEADVRLSFVKSAYKVALYENGTCVDSAVDEDTFAALVAVVKAWIKRINPNNAIRRLFEMMESIDGRQIRESSDKQGSID